MNRTTCVIKFIKMILGIPFEMPKKRDFEIKPKMGNQNVVQMDFKSFRKSKVVQEQAIAASNTNKCVANAR